MRTAQLWVESGVLRAWKTAGGHRRILRESVETLLAERSAAAEAPAPKAGTADVLVVEDDPVLLKVYEAMLRRLTVPVRVVLAQNGYHGLIQLGKTRPDVLITDLELPGLDGFHMLETLRRDRALARMEIIVVSGLAPEAIAARGGLPEDVVFIPKPVHIEELSRLLELRLAGLPGKRARQSPARRRSILAGA